MPAFRPRFRITPQTASALMRIETAREAIHHLPITPEVLAGLRESARLYSTHYSTMIEGNRLTAEQVQEVVDRKVGRKSGRKGHFPGRERDEKEVLGYYAAMARVEALAAAGQPLGELHIRQLHALVMNRRRATPYRDGQNVIRDGRTGGIVYLPPEAKDVPALMSELTEWVNQQDLLPCPIRAAIAHYQFATIHPYYDGNGRTARLLTTLILHLGGYGLKGLYSLEEYYARNLPAYYAALSVGPSHNYYQGRARSDITGWVSYFCQGMADSFERVKARAEQASAGGASDRSAMLRRLDQRQRRALELFAKSIAITSTDVQKLFGISQRTARGLLTTWAQSGFVTVLDPAKKSRRYGLSPAHQSLLQ